MDWLDKLICEYWFTKLVIAFAIILIAFVKWWLRDMP